MLNNNPVRIQPSARYRPDVEEMDSFVKDQWDALDFCKYDSKTRSVKNCWECGEGLCSFCGYRADDDHVFCNECWKDFEEKDNKDPEMWMDRTGRCWSCLSDLEPIYENNGFTEPAGPSHWEISGYKPCRECREASDL